MRWKIDENKELPLAIIEDTGEGNGIAEIGERTERNLAIAAEIVESHNRSTGEANGLMKEVSQGIWTSRLCTCPNPTDEDGAYCPLCGKCKVATSVPHTEPPKKEMK